MEKKHNERIREKKMESEEEFENGKVELKLQIHKQYELKEQKLNRD